MALMGRKRARAKDRDEAVEVINAAYGEGQLTAVQREDRVHRALTATHLGDLHQLTADLQPEAPAAPEPPNPWRSSSRRAKVAVAAAVLVVVGGGVVATQVGSDDDAVVRAVPEHVVPATAEGLAELIADQEEELGTTRSYLVSLQHEMSSVRVPTDDGRSRFQEWRPEEDGSFTPRDEVRGAGDYREFDLADVDIDALADTIDRAWAELEVPDPTDTTLVIQHGEFDDGPRISITVSNEFGEHGYVVTDLAGRELQRREFDPASP